jgi:hypothetical protein
MTRPSDEVLFERMVQMVNDEIRTKPARWMYLSYAGELGFNGGIIIEAHGMASAVARVHALNISPGGQVMGTDIPKEMEATILPPPEFRNRLLTKAELESFWGDMKTLGELEAEENNGKT